jgi:putative transposase
MVSLNKFYSAIGFSKQGLHQHLNSQLAQHSMFENLYKIVSQIRKDHPTLNCKAMYYKIMPEGLGRDKFERLCSEWGLTQERPVNRTRTTFSTGVIRFENIYKDVVFTKINQAFVSDITYYEVECKFYYITFIMDAFSRYIIGHNVSDRLLTEHTSIPAIEMALKYKNNKFEPGIIFHSDGGGQYYDKAFLELTKRFEFKNSMCEYAYENGKAERINGIIKNNYLKHANIKSLRELKTELDRAVSLYNNERPHKNLNYKTPKEIEKKDIFAMTNKAENERVIRCKKT